MTTMHMTKVPEYPRPHQSEINFDLGMESAVANVSTMLPIIVYDEGLGAMSAYESNPQNANFLEYTGPNCFPTSRINRIFCELTFALTKGAVETDKIIGCRFGTMVIHSAFNETGQAADEISTLDLNEVLELQVETTDRQMGPLFNAIDVKDGKTNATIELEADQAFLDTDLELEGIAWSNNSYYDCLNYFTTADKLKTVQNGLQWHTLTKEHPIFKMRVQQQSNTKFMNPFAFLGLMITCPSVLGLDQIGKAGEITDIGHINVTMKYRYLEYNHEFNHAML